MQILLQPDLIFCQAVHSGTLVAERVETMEPLFPKVILSGLGSNFSDFERMTRAYKLKSLVTL